MAVDKPIPVQVHTWNGTLCTWADSTLSSPRMSAVYSCKAAASECCSIGEQPPGSGQNILVAWTLSTPNSPSNYTRPHFTRSWPEDIYHIHLQTPTVLTDWLPLEDEIFINSLLIKAPVVLTDKPPLPVLTITTINQAAIDITSGNMSSGFVQMTGCENNVNAIKCQDSVFPWWR